MRSSREVILSQEEVCEAIREFVRAKYHEKIETGYLLSNVKADSVDKSVSFTFSETLCPFVKSSHGKS